MKDTLEDWCTREMASMNDDKSVLARLKEACVLLEDAPNMSRQDRNDLQVAYSRTEVLRLALLIQIADWIGLE